MLPLREARMAGSGASGRIGWRLAVGLLTVVTASDMAAAQEPDGRRAAGGADGSIDAGGLEAPAAPALLAPEKHATTQHLSDLSIGNFFTEGWNQDWEKW